MNNFKYKIGDRVIASDNICQHKKCPGTIVGLWYTSDHPTPYDVKFDDFGYSLWSEVHGLINTEQKIVITTDGTKITTATLYEDGKKVKTATAKCCPEDTFDFMVGAKLACERLTGAPVTKYKVGDRIFAEDNIGEYPGGAWGTVVEVLDKRYHREDYGVKFDNGYILCSHVVPVPTTPEKPKEETEWRVVNRPVKDGDYLRITRPTFTFDHVGDILKVSYVRNDGIAVVYAKDHPKETRQTGKFEWNYIDSEYEVVEKVNKAVEPPKPKYNNVKFNTGDRAKIIANKCRHEFEIGTIVTLEKSNIDYLATDDNGNSWWVIDDELEAYTPPKYYNGKVVCVSNSANDGEFTVGKVYEIVDGLFTDNNNKLRPTSGDRVIDLNDLANGEYFGKLWYYKFVPFVED